MITNRWGNVGIVLRVQPRAVRIPYADWVEDSRWVLLSDFAIVEPPIGQ